MSKQQSVLLQGFNLFSSADYAPAKNLMFKDSTTKLMQLPPNTDSFLYLGAEYMGIIRSLKRGISYFSLKMLTGCLKTESISCSPAFISVLPSRRSGMHLPR